MVKTSSAKVSSSLRVPGPTSTHASPTTAAVSWGHELELDLGLLLPNFPGKSPKTLWQSQGNEGKPIGLPGVCNVPLHYPHFQQRTWTHRGCTQPPRCRLCTGSHSPPHFCKVQTRANPDFGDFGIMGTTGAALQALRSLPRMNFSLLSQMLRKR